MIQHLPSLPQHHVVDPPAPPPTQQQRLPAPPPIRSRTTSWQAKRQIGVNNIQRKSQIGETEPEAPCPPGPPPAQQHHLPAPPKHSRKTSWQAKRQVAVTNIERKSKIKEGTGILLDHKGIPPGPPPAYNQHVPPTPLSLFANNANMLGAAAASAAAAAAASQSSIQLTQIVVRNNARSSFASKKSEISIQQHQPLMYSKFHRFDALSPVMPSGDADKKQKKGDGGPSLEAVRVVYNTRVYVVRVCSVYLCVYVFTYLFLNVYLFCLSLFKIG